MPYSTKLRLFDLSTPLGDDALLVHTVDGVEDLSKSFVFQLMLVSEQADLAVGDLLGKAATLRMLTEAGACAWSGYVRRFERVGQQRLADSGDNDSYGYACEMVSWLWFMQQHEDSRIFQELSIPDIIEEIFRDFSYSDYQLELSATYEPLTYCVQYQESNHDFIARLCERAGIYFYFRNEDGVEKMVLTDSHDQHQPLDPATITFHEQDVAEDADAVQTLTRSLRLPTGSVASVDFDFERPSTDLSVSVDALLRLAHAGQYQRFVHSTNYAKRDAGETLARVRIEAEEAAHEVFEGSGQVRGFRPGFTFTLDEHPQDSLNQQYLLTSVRHIGSNNLGGEQQSSYRNRFLCIPASVQFRAPLLTPLPRAHGLQTAIVTGPSGSEIHTDKYGRIKVQFHWDRRGQRDDKSSCWIRVAQLHASGKRWGGFAIPRVNEEVIIAFEHGDLDRPLVIGSLYNGDNMPPYALPDNATRSGIKTMSSPGGGGYNELRFEDKKGEEQVFIHGERNLDVRVKNDALEWIGNEQHLIVETDRLEQVKGDQHLTLTGDQNEKVDGTVSLKAGMDLQQKVGMKHAIDAGMEIHLKAGTNLVIEAGATLTLKVGGNFINLNPGGVFISGTMVMINSGGSAGSGSGASPTAPKAPTEADQAEPGEAMALAPMPVPPSQMGPQAATLVSAAQSGTPFCEKCEAARKAQAGQS